MACRVIPDPETGTPLIVPASRARRRAGRQQTRGAVVEDGLELVEPGV
jgi:hypothetical protein